MIEGDTMKSMVSRIIPLLLPLTLGAQLGTQALEARRAAAAQISALSGQLRFHDAAGEKRYRQVRDSITAQIDTSIDEYVAQKIDPSRTDSNAIGADLGELLGAQTYAPEYSGPPYAHIAELANGRSLVVGYMLVRGGEAVNDSAVSIRGYRAHEGSLTLEDVTGRDLYGYGLFTHELVSPIPGELWLLAWGPLSGYNENRTRLRVYAFDGNKFRTVWSPPDALNVTVNFTSSGFSVNHLDEYRYRTVLQPPYYVRDDYISVPDGVRQISTHHVDD